MEVFPLPKTPAGSPAAEAKLLDAKQLPMGEGEKAIPAAGDLVDKQASGSAKPSVSLVGGADKDHDGRIDRTVWEQVAALVDLSDIDGVPLASCSDDQIRREVLHALGIDRVEAMGMSDEAAQAAVQGKLKEMIQQAAEDYRLFAKQAGSKQGELRGATSAYRDLYYASHRAEVESRLASWQTAHQKLAIAQSALRHLGELAVQLFPITEIIKPELDVAVHPPKLPPKPPKTVEGAMSWEREQAPRPAKDPFKTPLWEVAKGLLTNNQRQGDCSITGEELNRLLAEACSDGVVRPEERQLILWMIDGDNLEVLEAAARSGKSVNRSELKAVDPDQPYAGGKSLGLWIDDKLDQTLAARQLGASAPSDRKLLRQEAAKAKIGPGQPLNLETKDGRWRVMDWISQMAQKNGVGDTSCVATSMVALAVSEGADGIKKLCQALLRENAKSEPAQRVLERLAKGGLSVKDLDDLAESLYTTLDAQEADKPDGKKGGILNETSWAFLKRNQDLLYVLFQSGGTLISLDTDGDASVNHMVASIPGPGGKEMIFEPSEADWGHDSQALGWQEESRHTRHHLLNQPSTVKRYLLAANETLTILNPKTEQMLKG